MENPFWNRHVLMDFPASLFEHQRVYPHHIYIYICICICIIKSLFWPVKSHQNNINFWGSIISTHQTKHQVIPKHPHDHGTRVVFEMRSKEKSRTAMSMGCSSKLWKGRLFTKSWTPENGRRLKNAEFMWVDTKTLKLKNHWKIGVELKHVRKCGEYIIWII